MLNWIASRFRPSTSVGVRSSQGKYLYRLIWWGCISVCIPVILAGAVYYQLSMNRVKEQITSEGQSSLLLMRDRSEHMLQGIEQESLKLSVDPILSKVSPRQDSGNSMIWHTDFLDKIALVKNSNSFIDEIYFYSSSENTVLSNRYGVIAKDEYRYREDIDRIIADGEISKWAYMPSAQKDGYITFARVIPNTGAEGAKGVLAFEIDTSSFSKFMEADSYILPLEQHLVIINYRKLSLRQDSGQEIINQLASLPGLDTILKAEQNADSFIGKGVNGASAQYLYSKNVFGRIYVTVVSEEVMAGQLNWIRGVTLLVLFFFILFGVILTYFNSKRAYNPIEQLMKHSKALRVGRVQSKENEFEYIKECLDFLDNESEKLDQVMTKIQPTLIERCLQQLLLGEYIRREPLLRDCEAFGISVNSTNVVLIVDADNITKDKRFRPEEKGIIAFVISNVMGELLQENESVQGYVIPYQGKGAALLQFQQDTDQATMLKMTMRYAHSVCTSLKHHLSMDVFVGVGRFYSHIDDVPVSYKEAEIAMQYRIFKDTVPVLFIEDLELTKKQSAFHYPKISERAILESLERGEYDAAAQYLSEFVESLSISPSYSFIYQSYYMLLFSIVDNLEKQGVNLLDILEHNLFGQLQAKQTYKEIYHWFVEVVFPLYQWLADNYRSESGLSAVKKVCKYIKENCSKDVSLVQCADLVGMSPSYLSRLFKKETGINFLEYVVECKMTEATRLLSETNQSISEVAEAVGYSERNLNRIFQRYTKMTPGTFRTKQRS
ncbi:helix-turn-helix domain-containing protein [Paenibacillus cremeus]|uniref:Helix-turn-helix domain-containing protein n=1 Tax=Paenibacillus cremeus TaxID=2163881 RepID=A0A559K735_9BACL|nr:helix-turn-helix domain-containing protein [Paenibacillus cremeus]TVY07941.1 helix-turn-helix domain-containing protein [Paenibacillus cremeus]